jgi:esterase/lipase superfamily enzyme
MRKLRFFIALLAVMLAVVYLSGYQMRFHDFNNITRALRLNIWWFTAGKKEYYRVVKVPFGTDREINIIENKQVVGLGRGGKLSLGRAEITVPKIHSIGQIERPTTWNPLNWLETRDKHFTLKTLEINDDSFKQLISEIAASSKSFENQALVFVHGYATSFEYALFRLAQMVYDLNFDGVPFLYSWPSAGGLSDYLGDE